MDMKLAPQGQTLGHGAGVPRSAGEAVRYLEDLLEEVIDYLDGDEAAALVKRARDVARQVAAEWQEQLKHQRKVSFRTFLDQLRESDQRKASRWFWRVQGLPGVLERWGEGLTPAQVHVVTVPRPGGPAEELWLRFCTALGLDPAWAPEDGGRRNPSIGTAESTR